VRMDTVFFDADGVLIDSSLLAWSAARELLSLFGKAPCINNSAEYKRHFGRDAQVRLAGEEGASALRAMHRVLMLHRCDRIRPFADVVDVANTLSIPAVIVTGAYAVGIRRTLGTSAANFRDIFGREHGSKTELLARFAKGRNEIYICDTVKDVMLCRHLRIRCVAVTWGYDTADDLSACCPDYLLGSVAELVRLLQNFGVIRDDNNCGKGSTAAESSNR
jgi:phosphoglycolate phosphatase-like HAD superfamily hydrolase